MIKTTKDSVPIENKKSKLALIHVAKKAVAITDDAYRAILEGSAGIDSAASIEFEWQFNAIMQAFKNLGFKHKVSEIKKTDTKAERNSQWITARQEYYIKGLWDLASRQKDVKSLRRIIRRISGVDDISFLSKEAASKVILALRDITQKAGYNPEKKE